MEGKEIIERVKEVIGFINSGDNSKAVLYLNYIMEDIEMYKRSSLWLDYSTGLNINGLNINVKVYGIYEKTSIQWVWIIITTI